MLAESVRCCRCEEFLNDLKHVGLDAESSVGGRWAFFVRAGKFDLHP
jgi:hypothetical protein